ncbi:MAG TPA: hypothetical protein VHX38_20135 [Pseudonocardiaceae bacterium]|jgi:hypothetical protein|nr:hypothetical protein [Pseudonocardiaceae bacterium]
MNYLRGFIPWIALAIVSAFSWQWAALVALALSVGLLIQARRSRIALDSQILEISTLVYFAALTVLAFSQPHSAIQHYTGALSMTWLAITAFGTLAIRRPFTLGIAKRQTPKEFWNTPVFTKVNWVITTVWAIAFALTAITLFIFDLNHLGAGISVPVQVAGFVLPALFTHTYPERVRARYADQIPGNVSNG